MRRTKHFIASRANPDSRTRAVAEVLQEWESLGRIPGWRDEWYRVSSRYAAEPVFFLERAAASLFGITSYGVHLNGIAGDPEKKLLWLARRAKDRPQYPAMDHLVAGGADCRNIRRPGDDPRMF